MIYFVSSGVNTTISPIFPLLLLHYWSHELILLPINDKATPPTPTPNPNACDQFVQSIQVGSDRLAYLQSLTSSNRVGCSTHSGGLWMQWSNILYDSVETKAESKVGGESQSESESHRMVVVDMNDAKLRQLMHAIPSASERKSESGIECEVSLDCDAGSSDSIPHSIPNSNQFIPSYILVLGDCIASPTSLKISSSMLSYISKSTPTSRLNTHSSTSYSLIEDMCKEGKSRKNKKVYDSVYTTEYLDVGAVLYRLTSELEAEYELDTYHTRGFDTSATSDNSIPSGMDMNTPIPRYALTKRLQHNLITRKFVHRLEKNQFE